MSAIDHKTAAERALDFTHERWPFDPSRPVSDATNGWLKDSAEVRAERRAEALVHATLYAGDQAAELAKQQTIANLIAYTQAEGGPYKFINWTDGANEKVLTLIREGLGLS